MRPARTLLVATAVLVPGLALVSCAELHWRKTNGDDSALAQDLTACRKQAMQRTVLQGSAIPRSELSPVFGPLGPSPAEVRMQESQGVNVCMRDKGYALVPDSPRTGN